MKNRTMSKRVCILNAYVDNLTMRETIEVVDSYIKNGKPLHLMGINADKINLLNKDEKLKKIVNSCEVINADGNSVVWASKVLDCRLPERVAGIDLMQELIALAVEKGYRVYFLGAKEEVVTELVKIYRKHCPKLLISGYRNGYFQDNEWDSVGMELQRCNPQLVFVGITSPKKEYLVEHWMRMGINSVFMGVGGSFDVLSHKIPRAPVWMQRCGLEWLFRVIQEPRRLFKRYFVGNIRFITAVYREKMRKKKDKKESHT